MSNRFTVSDIQIGMCRSNNVMACFSQDLRQILAKHSGQPIERISQETERDRYFSAWEAKEFGLVDEVILKMSEEEKKK